MKSDLELTPEQVERLNKLIEACAQTIVAASTVLNYGYPTTHPRIKENSTNRLLLERAIGVAQRRQADLMNADDINVHNVTAAFHNGVKQ